MNRVNQGFTLIESMITVAIMAIVATFALPVLTSGLTNNSLKSASQELLSEISLARTTAMKNNANVEISFVDGANWCYGIDHDTSNTCSCSTKTNCTKVIDYTNYSDITLDNKLNSSNTKLLFTSNRGRLHSSEGTSGTLEFDRNGTKVSVDINKLGKARTCSSHVGGMGAC